jgi:hypothetical protein
MKKSILKKWWFWVLAAIVAGLIIKSLGGTQKIQTATELTDSAKTVASLADTNIQSHRINLAKFNEIQPGMTRDEVEQIINGTHGISNRTEYGTDLLIHNVGEDMSKTDLGGNPFIVRYNAYGNSGYADIAYNAPKDPVNELPKVASKTQSGLK